jgi:hypothetical protein
VSKIIQPLNPLNSDLIKSFFLSITSLLYLGDAVFNNQIWKSVFLFIFLLCAKQILTSSYGQLNAHSISPISTEKIIKKPAGVGTGLLLSEIFPKQIAGITYNIINTTPVEVSQNTNLKDILTLDYTIGDSLIASVVATKTMNAAYDHSKIATDRLKGFELFNIQNMIVSSVNLVRYDMKNKKGRVVYGTNFSIGAQNGRYNYTIQSTWLTKDYVGDEMMFNIQILSESLPTIVNLSKDIIYSLKNGLPVTAIPSVASNPKAFFTSAKYKSSNVVVTVNNSSLSTTGYIELLQKKTEQTTVLLKKQIPITIPLNSKSSFNLSVVDYFESTINLYMNSLMVDQMVVTDGNWGATVDSTKGVLNSFKINSSTNFSNSDSTEYKLLRNIQVDATVPDFVSLYKLLVSDASSIDLSAYKTLQFTASSTGASLLVTLIKKSILNWSDQFSIIVPISTTSNDYKISLDDFISTATADKIIPDDISMIVFGITSSNPAFKTITADINTVSFTMKDLAYLNSLHSTELLVYPNPNTNGKMNVSFKAPAIYPLTLQITDLATGKVILQKKIYSQIGPNIVPVNMGKLPTNNIYILSLRGEGIQYISKKILSNRN